ncbi:hypothetical protein AXF42_Ash016327 [Apostasia shenzhenica]|uniref:Uncharacterized protein n=1 Tax=Apostasia shenzhenica TaxID=1088818 RepID=A0A2H9ZXF0_9ASPA|nr:hypothetical protein AXF42_Ash016327 [Apostasia shenzhenica]
MFIVLHLSFAFHDRSHHHRIRTVALRRSTKQLIQRFPLNSLPFSLPSSSKAVVLHQVEAFGGRQLRDLKNTAEELVLEIGPLLKIRLKKADLGSSMLIRRLKTIFVHYPIRLSPVRRTALVEHQCLPHPNHFGLGEHGFISSGGLPESGGCCSVRPSSARVLLILVAEKVPLALLLTPHLALFCSRNKSEYSKRRSAQ